MNRSPAWMSAAAIAVTVFAFSATSQRAARGDALLPHIFLTPARNLLAPGSSFQSQKPWMAASPGSSTNGSATAPPRPSQNESAARTSYPSTTQSEKPPVKEPPCSTLEYHQFDFWLGDWDAFDMGKPDVVVARTKITSILNGCAILEEYDQSDGMHGRSFSIYDSTRKIWHQTWVTNNGRLLVIEGRCETGAMTLAGIDHPAGETEERYIRGIWKSEGSGVRETAQTSRDAGKTWQPWFDIVFRKH